MAGHGSYFFAPDGRFDGRWAAPAYDGAGCETFGGAGAALYRGTYRAGLRDGSGACRAAAPAASDYFEGGWAGGAREGLGAQLSASDGSAYVGDYHGGQRAGVGVYAFANGDTFSGILADDLPHVRFVFCRAGRGPLFRLASCV
jgi:hypothetical protein